MTFCPCGLKKKYTSCCGPYIKGTTIPKTPEALMRSRYTAYTLANIDYIIQTMRAPAADRFDTAHAHAWAKRVEWKGLNVLDAQADRVEFIAHFNDNGKPQAIHELSTFQQIGERWYYIDGKPPKQTPITRTIRPERNDPCHCGSGKKYKRCCVDKEIHLTLDKKQAKV